MNNHPFKSYAGILLLGAFSLSSALPAQPTSQTLATTTTLSHTNDPILATVNGAPIYESDVSDELMENSFEMVNSGVKKDKVERLIQLTLHEQFLKKQNIAIDSKAIDAEVERLRREPPQSSCMCCRYTSFDDFLQKNYYTLSEFRREIAVDFGMTKYMGYEWDKKHLQGAEQKAMVEKERGRLEKEYVKMAHIFFNTAQKPEYANAPEKVIGEANRKAKDAWMRLRMGTDFEKLAAEISEDTLSKSKGGNVGCVSVYAFGNVLKEVKATQKVGEYGKPVESPFGVHIIKFLP
ncbi:TPA: hypothetical protein DDW35_12090, partial [Candidatus Sumerlaeota bacterium]|nr:hypothetical protein [Candidatus Sumerlaeota bacterium]